MFGNTPHPLLHIATHQPPSQEPSKAQLVAFNKTGATPPRSAFCILQFPPSLDIVEATIDLHAGKVLEWTDVPNAQPVATPDDCFEAEAIVKQDETVKKLLADRGITNTDLVACDPWCVTPVVNGLGVWLFALIG